MKKLLLSISTALLLATFGKAQITTSAASLPQLEDTLYTIIDTFPYIFILDASPVAQDWQFTQLNADVLNTTILEPASSGAEAASFPDADVVLPFFDGEGYAQINSNSIEIIGYNGSPLETVQSFVATTAINPSSTYRLTNLTYGDTHRDSTYFQVVEAGANLDPDETIITVDSARITITSIREDTVDAFGTMTTPFGTYEVIRLKQTEYRNTQIEAKIPPFDWMDVGEFIDGLGDEIIETYYWLSADSKEPIAKVERNPATGFNRFCEWKIDRNFAMVVNNEEVVTAPANIKVYPNPAVNEVNFELNNLRAGRYTLNFYNVIGRKVMSQIIDINGSHFHTVNLAGFGKGIYLYSFINENGEVILTKQLVVKRP